MTDATAPDDSPAPPADASPPLLCTRCGDACVEDRLVLPELPFCRSCFETVTEVPGLPGQSLRQALSQGLWLGLGVIGGGLTGGLLGLAGSQVFAVDAIPMAFTLAIVGLFAGMIVIGVARQHEIESTAARDRLPRLRELWSLPEPDVSARVGLDLVRRQPHLQPTEHKIEQALLLHSPGGLVLVGQNPSPPRHLLATAITGLALVEPLFGQPTALGVVTSDGGSAELLHFVSQTTREDARRRARRIAGLGFAPVVEQTFLEWHAAREQDRRGPRTTAPEEAE